ncbi:MAG: hypothetical protein JJE53_01635 [Candidatus Pacebacteria bacterium]|nr:hypothetical protein [Candidatus Paceibacterota bacterium]
MDKDKLDSLLYSRTKHYNDGEDLNYENHYLEQYRMYLHIFNSTSDRRNKSNEFFLGLNTAIIGVLGFLETKGTTNNNSVIFIFAPIVGIAICYCWYEIIISYKQLNRAKFKVIHNIEEKLPLSLFKTEWELLGKGNDYKKYIKLSSIEKNIPIIFIVLYSVIFTMSLPWEIISYFIK